MVNMWLCVVSAIAWLLLAGFAGKTSKDYLHPAVVFSILFAVSYPLKLMMSFYGFHILDSMAVDDETIFWAIVIFNLAGISFVAPLLLQKNISTNLDIFKLRSFPIYITFTLAVIFLITSHGIQAFNALFSVEALQERIVARGDERVGSGLSSLIRQVNSFMLIVFALQFVKQEKIKNVFYVFLVVAYSWLALAISGSKYEALFLMAVIVIAYYYWNRAKGIDLLSINRVIIGSVAALILVGIVGYIRGFGAFNNPYSHSVFLQVVHQLSNAFDAPDNLIVLLERAETWLTGELGLVLARDYLILSFIPRAIWDGKPLVQGNQLVMESYFPERFFDYTGEVISPSFPGEMILTGGLFYMVIMSVLLGVLLGWLYRKSQSYGGLYFVAYLWCLLNIFNFLRSGTGAVGSFVVFMVIAVGVHFLVNIIHFTIYLSKFRKGLS